MYKNKNYLLAGITAVVFTLLFYHQSIGLNLILFEIILVFFIARYTPVSISGVHGWVLTAGIAVTAVFTLIHASVFVIAMNVIALFLFTGLLLLPGGRSIASFTCLAFVNIVQAPANAFNQVLTGDQRHTRTLHRIRQATWLILPLFLIMFFIWLYSSSNPYFATIIDRLFKYPDKWLNILWENMNPQLAFTFIFGLFTGILFFFRRKNKAISEWDENSTDNMLRKHRKFGRKNRRMLALKNEYRAGVFLLVILNLLIFLQNVLDIWFVWFHFEWNGQYLKQFVHEGTWLLIFSILISIVIILLLYQGNLNFLPHNRFLRLLSYTWLVQNMVLAVSVAVRNGWYIYYYALAYKRIGVGIFLVLTLVGLVSVLLKVKHRKTMFYLLRINTLSIFILLVAASCINWDPVIARYNFAHYERSFIHLDWLCSLSDKSLPILDKSPAELAKIKQIQDKAFPSDHGYMSPETYHEIIQERKRDFISNWENRSILSFNLADYLAFRRLCQQDFKVRR
jgi:hypothetical protein